jgi:GTP-binding protein EngB required for normal cell division
MSGDRRDPEPEGAASLNGHQARALYAAAVTVRRLLGEIDTHAGPCGSPLERYADDLSPAQKQGLRSFARSAYARMAVALTRLGVPTPGPSGSVRAAVSSALTFAEIALHEVGGGRLRGYGGLAPQAEAGVERMLADVGAALAGVRSFLNATEDRDLAKRIAQLAPTVPERDELAWLEAFIRARGLVGLHASLEALLEQVESGIYEVAIFGRVSAGKSSLINALLGEAVLPVGVQPVTSVPTRLVWAPARALLVRAVDSKDDERRPIDELGDFVSEEGNPGNARRVRRVTVELPVDALRGGVALVDTPGLNALATAGAREAYSYLPRCDLGVLVLDGGGTVEADDVDVARALVDSGIEVVVVISKADRIAESERAALSRYVHDALVLRLGLDVDVRWVSAMGDASSLVETWFEGVLAPRLARASGLAKQSARRKLDALTGLARRAAEGATQDASAPGTSATLDHIGGESARLLETQRRVLESVLPDPRQTTLEVLRSAAATMNRSHSATAGKVLRAALLASAERRCQSLRVAVLETRDRVRALLDDAARAAGVPVDRAVVSVDMTGMPRLALPPDLDRLHLSVPRLTPWREQRIAEWLASEAGGSAEAALRDLDKSLRAWAAVTLGRMRDQLGSQLDPLRAATNPSVTTGTNATDSSC